MIFSDLMADMAVTNQIAQVSIWRFSLFLLEIILFSITKCFNLPVDIFGHELRQERMEWRALS